MNGQPRFPMWQQIAAIILALPGAIALGLWQESWWAALVGHTLFYLLFYVTYQLSDLRK